MKNKFTGLIDIYRELPIQAKASAWFFVCAFLQRGISTLTTPIFTRLLTTAEYGQYNVFNSWLSILTIFVTLQLYSGVYTQGLVKYNKERNVFSSSLQGLTTTLVAIWTVVYLMFRDFWNRLFSLTTVQMLAMLLMIWATAAFNFWAAEQRVELKYRRLVLVTLLVSFAKPLIGIFFVINAEDKVTARILGLAIVEVVGYIGLYCSQMTRGKKFFSGKFWKYALIFNLPLLPHYLSQTVLSGSDRIMISYMVGASAAGIYGLAYSASQIMTVFNSALSQTMSPWIYQKIKEDKTEDIHGVAYGSLALIAVANLLLIALAPEVIAIFAPAAYYDAIWVIPPVAMSVYFIFAYDLFAKFAFYYERTGFIAIASVIGAVANILLNFIFIPRFGYVAAGYTTLFCYATYATAHYIFMNKVCKEHMGNKKPYSIRVLLLITVVFMVLGFYFLLTYNFVFLRYASLLAMIVVMIIERKQIVGVVRSIMEIRNKK